MSADLAQIDIAASPQHGDVDIAIIGGVLADPGRCRMLLREGIFDTFNVVTPRMAAP